MSETVEQKLKPWESKGGEGEGEGTKPETMNQNVGDRNFNRVTEGKGKQKKFKAWKQKVLEWISIEKALDLVFMVELNLEEVGFMVEIGLKFILYISAF